MGNAEILELAERYKAARTTAEDASAEAHKAAAAMDLAERQRDREVGHLDKRAVSGDTSDLGLTAEAILRAARRELDFRMAQAKSQAADALAASSKAAVNTIWEALISATSASAAAE